VDLMQWRELILPLRESNQDRQDGGLLLWRLQCQAESSGLVTSWEVMPSSRLRPLHSRWKGPIVL
jgi:hypothetical protein